MPPHPESRPGPAPWGPVTILIVAAACGLLAGLVEVAAHGVRSLVFHRILAFGSDFVWMTLGDGLGGK